MADHGNDLYEQHPGPSITTDMVAKAEAPKTSTIDLAVRVSPCAQPLRLRLYFHHDGQTDGPSGSAPSQRIDAFYSGHQGGPGKPYFWTPTPKPGWAELLDKNGDNRCHRAAISKPLPLYPNPATLPTLLCNAASWVILFSVFFAGILTLSWQAAVLVPFLGASTALLCLAHHKLILLLAIVSICRSALAKWLRRQDHFILIALVGFGLVTAIWTINLDRGLFELTVGINLIKLVLGPVGSVTAVRVLFGLWSMVPTINKARWNRRMDPKLMFFLIRR